ncbi:MAG: tRNA lysidine(34) synthetase TilS [Actinomycetota bacterium]
MADSVALLHLAARRCDVVAMHVDHGLRPTSGEDARAVEQHARQLGIPFLVRRVAVERTGSLEAAARAKRYSALEEMAAEADVSCVLTAHTLDDQAETVLLRLMRGDVLDGIAPARGIFHRPLLQIRRDELRAWLREHEIAWREDPTNDDVRFERNWVRHVLLPQLEERRANVSSVVARLADRTRADTTALDVIADQIVATALSDDVGLFLRFDELPDAVASRIVRRAFRRLGHDPTSREVAAALTSPHTLAGAIDVWRLDRGVAFTGAPFPVMPELRLGDEPVSSKDWQLTFRVTDAGAAHGRWQIAVPHGALAIRSRVPGDRITTRSGTRKVQDVLVDARVPRPLRDLLPVVTVDDRSHAVVGAGSMTTPTSTDRIIDIDPLNPTWSRELAWMG